MTVGPVVQHRLKNGLVILAQEDNRAPIVAFHTWYGVGSRHERPGKTGMAHLFEHLMFKETSTIEEGGFDRRMEAVGARTNAATWTDWTYYYEKLPAQHVELAFELEADRMENMVLGPDQLASEREVVMNERRLRVDNDPEGTMYERLYAEHFGASHPYGWPTIGWMEDIRAISLEDCIAFYRQHYAPNNATVVVVGDIPVEQTFRFAEKYYGHMEGQPSVEEDWPILSKACTERVELALPVSSERLLWGIRTPGLEAPELASWEVFNEILLNAESSRGHQDLIYSSELASGVSGWLGGFRHPGLLHLDVQCKPEARAEDAASILKGHVEAIGEKGLAAGELDRALAKLESDFQRQKLSAAGSAYGLGLYQCTLGDYTALERSLARLRDVSEENVREVALQFLAEGQSTQMLIKPAAAGGTPQ